MWHWNKSQNTKEQIPGAPDRRSAVPSVTNHSRFASGQRAQQSPRRDLQPDLDRGIDAGFVYYEER
jgi:hypothetical protein